MPRHRRPTLTEDFDDDDDCVRHGEKPGQRNAANARERARMRILSKAFSRLKTTLPWVPPDTKLSKLDTLRLATSYIAHLRTILTDDSNQTTVVHPLNLTWPFTIQQHSPADVSRSPDWSSEEHSSISPPHHQHVGLLNHLSDPLHNTEVDSDETSRHHHSRNMYNDHRHYSDSLLNIG